MPYGNILLEVPGLKGFMAKKCQASLAVRNRTEKQLGMIKANGAAEFSDASAKSDDLGSLAVRSSGGPSGSPGPTLSELEEVELGQCEHIIEIGLAEFFTVGRALLTIRDRRLYQRDYPTFEEYCHRRWGFGRSYASRVIAWSHVGGG